METILEITGVEKQYLGCRALLGVDMAIKSGEIIGLLGPNASGKTTLLKIIAGLQQPTAGTVQYTNITTQGSAKNQDDSLTGSLAKQYTRQIISYCPDTMKFPKWMKVKDVFTYYSEMYHDYSQERADELIKTLELDAVKNKKVTGLSKGMQERLALATTFSRETKLYLLDEPLDGIDPVGKTRVIDAIISMQPEGASTLISTHLVKDIERVLTSVFFLSRGKIIFSGECDTIREERNQTVEQAYLEVFINEGTH